MAQIGKDYYEDLTAERFSAMLDEMAAGNVPVPGPQNGRFAAEPLSGLTSLKDHEAGKPGYNASAQLAVDIGDSIKRIDGTEVPLLTPWQGKAAPPARPAKTAKPAKAKEKPAGPFKTKASADATGVTKQQAQATSKAKPVSKDDPKTAAKTDEAAPGKKPRTLKAPRKAGADDLKLIKGVGPKLETMLNTMGFYHFDQIAKWGDDEVAWVDQNLEGFKGRATRDTWVEQAQKLAAGEETAFAAKARKDGRYDGGS